MAPDHQPSIESQTQPHAQYYCSVLHELIDIGADFARQIHRQACPPAQAPHAPGQTPTPSVAATQELSIAFDRIARAIRRTIALAQTVFEPVAARPARGFASRHDPGARRRSLRAVNDTFQPDEAEFDPARMTDRELQERLDTLDLGDDRRGRPIAEIIDDICCDLGIAHLPDSHPGKHRILADIATLIAATDIITAPNSTPAEIVVALAAHRRHVASKSTDPP